MKTFIKHSIAIVALVFGSLAAQAQVKIGTSPTVIGPNSNLEVEASTANRKVKVDKVTGQVTIQDGTEGLKKVLTSDAVGGASWQLVNTASIAPLPKGRMSGASTPSPLYSSTQALSFSNFDIAVGGFTQAFGTELIVPVTGYYILGHSVAVLSTGGGCPAGTVVSTVTTVTVNTVPRVSSDDRIATILANADQYICTGSDLVFLNANDIISVLAYSNTAAPTPTCNQTVTGGQVWATYQP